jgi:hypothetical protein
MSELGEVDLRRAPVTIVGACLCAAGYDSAAGYYDVTPHDVEPGVVGQAGGWG